MCERPFNMNVEFEWRRISGIEVGRDRKRHGKY